MLAIDTAGQSINARLDVLSGADKTIRTRNC